MGNSNLINRAILFAKKRVKALINFFYSWYLRIRYVYILKRVKRKDKIKIVFLVIHPSIWKYDLLYELLSRDKKFNPVVVVCPYTAYGEEVMEYEMQIAYETFANKGFTVINSFDKNSGKWIDIEKDLQPDFIFFTNPYKLTNPKYLISNLSRHALTFYVSYSYMITNRPRLQYKENTHNFTFRFFLESNWHKSQAKKYTYCRGINTVVSGYPGFDRLINSEGTNTPVDVWKDNDRNKKRIIWAPHHTIEPDDTPFNYSDFLSYHSFFLDLTDKYKDQLVFTFKPHPILRAKLTAHPDWGLKRTEEYYKEWETRSNCQISEGEYIDLFLTSDAIIHDSGSFIAEYLVTNKPSLYMVRHRYVLSGFSVLGQTLLDCHYKSYDEKGIHDFIENVVIRGEDTLKDRRENVIRKYLMPPNGKTASENIFNEINRILGTKQY